MINESEINLPFNADEHAILIDALNSYNDVIQENLPIGIESLLPKDDPAYIRLKNIKTVREKLLNNWSSRFD